MSISLLFAPCMRVAGEVLHGETELHFPQVIEDGIEEVHVRLKGWMMTSVSRQFGTQHFTRQERTELIKEFLTVWTKGTAFPPPGSQVLRIPFSFTLPIDIQPSFQYNAAYKSATIGYFLEVVGVRKGTFNSNRRVIRPFAVVRHDVDSASVRAALRHGWSNGWTPTERVAKIRRGVWGGHSDVKMELLLPKASGFPLFTRIPFKLRVTTVSKEMRYEKKDESETERVFPTLPLHPKEVDLSLRRQVYITARRWSAIDTETVSPLGGMGKAASTSGVGVDHDVVKTYEKTWVPSNANSQTGSWRQETEMQSSFELKWSPSFSTQNLTQRYFLRLKVSFSGIGNNLEADIPIRITSGMVTPTEAEAPPYDGPPPALDLPPTYWAATDWERHDEKASPSTASGSDERS